MKNIIYNIKCRFDETLLGFLELPKEKYENKKLSNELFGFSDARCDMCRVNFGNYPEMQERFTSAGGTIEQFEKHMKKNEYKNTKLEDAIKNIKEGKDPDAPRKNIV